MSVDFGPVPMPTSPIQTYFEERFQRDRLESPTSVRTEPEEDKPLATRPISKREGQLQRESDRLSVVLGAEETKPEASTARVEQTASGHERKLSLGEWLLAGARELVSLLLRDSVGTSKVRRTSARMFPLPRY